MVPKDLLRFFGRLRIKEDNGFEEISEQKITNSEIWGHVLPLFFGKMSQKYKEKQPMKNKMPEEFDPAVGQRVKEIDRWSTRGSSDGEEEGGN
jgi:hypothetical protein